ncbi:MAG: phosphohydrolase, partial [Longicatena sp.]
LDADRMDYLLRDAYFTGTSYGNFDLERILRTIRMKDGRIVVKQSGIHSVEDYIMARYHMYWQVYLHPVARSYEILLSLLFKRLKEVYQSNPSKLSMVDMFHPFLSGEKANIDALYRLDESAALYGFSQLVSCEDSILKDLAYRLLNRHLFEYITLKSEQDLIDKIAYVESLGYDPKYYVYQDAVSQMPYSPYASSESGHNIWVLDEENTVIELSNASDIVRALTRADLKEEEKIYYPKVKIEF